MTKLVLVRHGESEWNKLNLFTGWTDVELSDKGRSEAAAAGQLLREAKSLERSRMRPGSLAYSCACALNCGPDTRRRHRHIQMWDFERR